MFLNQGAENSRGQNPYRKVDAPGKILPTQYHAKVGGNLTSDGYRDEMGEGTGLTIVKADLPESDLGRGEYGGNNLRATK